MHEIITIFVEAMNRAPPGVVALFMLLTAYGGVLVLMRLFGIYGLVAFVIVAILGANIQVLKVVQFAVFPHPVALGTILFASSYLAIDLVTEYYGSALARRIIWLGFCCVLLFNVFMILMLGYRPVDVETSGPEYAFAIETERALKLVIQPQLGLLVAGLTSYLISQHLDVWLFAYLKRKTSGGSLWLRNNVSAIAAAFIDNTVFSLLAWRIFAATPVPWDTLIYTYILGTFSARVFIALLDTPFMYLSRRVFRNSPHYVAPAEDART